MFPKSGHYDMKPPLNYLNDPNLRTSAENHDFKYVRASDLSTVIDNVRRDRLKNELWSNFCQQKPTEGGDSVTSLNKMVEKRVTAQKSCLKPSSPNVKSSVRVLNDQEIDEIVNAAIEAKLRQQEVTIEEKKPPAKHEEPIDVPLSMPSCSTVTTNSLPAQQGASSVQSLPQSSSRSFSSHTSITSRRSSSSSATKIRASSSGGQLAEFTRLEQVEIKKLAVSREENLKFLDTFVQPTGCTEKNLRQQVVDVKISTTGAVKTKSKPEKCTFTQEMWTYFARITSEQKKMWQLLQEIQHNLENIPEIEDDNDLRLRKHRAGEFSVRFARNFLYEIGKLTEDVRVAHKYNTDMCRRIFLLFHALQRAFVTYSKQMRHFMIDGAPEKLETLMTLTMNATRLCFEKGIFDPGDSLIEMLNAKCEHLRSSSVEQQLHRPKKLVVKKSSSLSQRKSKDRLSMYRSSLSPVRSKPRAVKKIAKVKKVSPNRLEPVMHVTSVPKQTCSKRLSVLRVTSNVETAVQQFSEQPDDLTGEDSYETKLLQVLDAINKNQAEEVEPVTLEKLQILLEAISKPCATPPIENKDVEERPAKNILYSCVESKSEERPHQPEKGEPCFLREKAEFQHRCSTDPLYSNENFEKPWQTISKISDHVVDETLKLVIDNFDFGEKQIIKDFLDYELN